MSKDSRKPDLSRLLELHKLLLNFQAIERYVYGTGDRPENDVEHSYHLAMIAWYIVGFFPELNTDKVIKYALAHDLVEVHAGDTVVFDSEQLASKQQREEAALKKLAKEWKDFPDMIQSLTRYEQRADEEAKFVYALDKITPLILNIVREGHSWHKHEVSFEQLHDVKKDKVKAHPTVEEYYQDIYRILVENPHFFPTKKSS